MESRPAPWITALRHSHGRLRELVEPLDEDQLRGQAYPKEWSIAQTLSHLGSGAEIFGLFLGAGLAGEEPPGQEAFAPVWAAWNGKSPAEQATDALSADNALVERLESLSPEQLAGLRLAMFGMDVDAAMLARMRLGEHALHSWDVAVALDPSATLPAEPTGLLIDTVDQFAGRMGKPAAQPRRVRVTTSGPERAFVLDTGEPVSITDGTGAGAALPALALPAEALIRLVYGRLDAGHTPAGVTSDVDLDELRAVFPGF